MAPRRQSVFGIRLATLTRSVAGLLFLGWVGCERPPASAPSASQPDAGQPPNVIIILTDDQAPNTTGFEGAPVIRTPHLDRMASEGAVFRRAYVPLAQCGPSRAAILTGRYPHEIGAMSNEAPRLPSGVPTIAQVLKPRGYRCGLVGKWHQGEPLKPQAGFEDYWVSRDKDAREKEAKYIDPVLVVNGQPREHHGYLDDVLTDYALEFIRESESRGSPYLLWLSYYGPHEPLTVHPDPRFSYLPREVPLPASMEDDLSGKPAVQRKSACHEWFRNTPRNKLRQQIAAYYSMISAIDADIGRILDHLRKGGRETVVIYLSDNGWLKGEHQLLRKGAMLYEELVRTPLVIWGPGLIPVITSDALVSSMDLFPTVAGIAGALAPEGLSGYDLRPLITGTSKAARAELFFEFQEKTSTGEAAPMLGVVTARHKYSRYLNDGSEEFYDLESDRAEMRNLADRGGGEFERHRKLVDGFQSQIRTPFWDMDTPP